MPVFKNIEGQVYGRLTALTFEGRDRNKMAIWKCQCECGKETSVRLITLTQGSTRSCGCLNTEVRERTAKGNEYAKTHGLSKHPLYSTWATMKQRCYNPNTYKFNHYGGRGIQVCEAWLNSFEIFLKDMGERPEGATLNRINNDGDYHPDNCEWSSYSDQNRNRRKYTRNMSRINQ